MACATSSDLVTTGNQSMEKLTALLESKAYWATMLFGGAFLMAVALYYQHIVGEDPCQACVQVRVWIVAGMFVSLVMLLLPRKPISSLVGLLVILGTGLGLAERSWFLYQIENGRGDGSCGFMLGAPDWFPIDRWLPGIFEVRNLCSFTPDVLFGISMAEALLIVSAIVLSLTMAALLASVRSLRAA